jgi:hypothetical protein
MLFQALSRSTRMYKVVQLMYGNKASVRIERGFKHHS